LKILSMLKVMVIVDFGSCMDEENHVLVRSAFIHELKNHKSDYFPIFGTEMRLKYILDDLHLPTNSSGNVREDKWLTLPDMGHIIETCYNRAVVQLILPKRGICETNFPIRGAPPLNSQSNIMSWLNSRPLFSCFFERKLYVTTALYGVE